MSGSQINPPHTRDLLNHDSFQISEVIENDKEEVAINDTNKVGKSIEMIEFSDCAQSANRSAARPQSNLTCTTGYFS